MSSPLQQTVSTMSSSIQNFERFPSMNKKDQSYFLLQHGDLSLSCQTSSLCELLSAQEEFKGLNMGKMLSLSYFLVTVTGTKSQVYCYNELSSMYSRAGINGYDKEISSKTFGENLKYIATESKGSTFGKMYSSLEKHLSTSRFGPICIHLAPCWNMCVATVPIIINLTEEDEIILPENNKFTTDHGFVPLAEFFDFCKKTHEHVGENIATDDENEKSKHDQITKGLICSPLIRCHGGEQKNLKLCISDIIFSIVGESAILE